jgi:hypothetical protein
VSAYAPPPEWDALRVVRSQPLAPPPAPPVQDEFGPENESLRQGIRIGALGAAAMGAVVVFNVLIQSPIGTTDATALGLTPTPAIPAVVSSATPGPTGHASAPTPFAPPKHPWHELPRSWGIGESTR